MKRKNWGTNSEDPPPTGSSFNKSLHGAFPSKIRSSDAASQETQGIGFKETIKFRDLDSYKLQDFSSVPLERNQGPRFDEPKTSEYAFFKKLKEDAGHGFHSHLLKQDKTQSINFKRSDHSRERSNVIENSHNDFMSSLPENVKPDILSFNSPPDNTSNKSVVDIKRAGTTMADVCNMQDNVEEYGGPCKNSGIFYQKRNKLRRLVAKTSYPEVDEFFSKGHNIVSVLLSRLFPDSTDNKGFEVSKTETLDVDTKSRSLISPEFDICFKKSHWSPARNFMELDSGPSWDVGFLSCWSNVLRERELPNPKSPCCYSHGTYIDNSKMQLGYESSERPTPILPIKGDSAFYFDVKKHGRLMSRHLKELDDFLYPIEPLHEQEPKTLLLGWDADNTVDRSYLCTASQNAELSMRHVVSSLHGNDQQQNLDDRFTASRLFTQSLVSYHPPNLLPPQFSSSASNKSHHFAECLLKFNDDIVADANNFFLSSPDTTNCLNMGEYSNYRTNCKGSSILLSPLNQLWFMRDILNEEHHFPGKEDLYPAGLDVYIDPKCKTVSGSSSDHYSYSYEVEFPRSKQMSSDLIGYENENYSSSQRGSIDQLCEDMIDIHDWSSSYIEMPLDKTVCPLLLDKSHWDKSDGQKYSDEDEVEF